MGQEPDENEDLSEERRIDKRKDIVSVSLDVNESLAEVSRQLAASSSGDEVCRNLESFLSDHMSQGRVFRGSDCKQASTKGPRCQRQLQGSAP